MLPGRGLIARIRGKGDAYGAILASWALGPPQCKEGMRGFMGRRGGRRGWRVAALGQATQRVAASAERARRAAGLAGAAGAAMVGTAGAAVVGAAVQGRRWWARWCGGRDAAGARQAAVRRCGDAAMVTALELAAQQAQWKRVTVAARSRGSLGAIHQLEWRLFAQTGEHCRDALFERSDELLIHFEHLLQISGRGVLQVISSAGRAGHGELRCQSSGNVVGGNFVPMARNGKQAYRCRTSRLWTRDGLSRSTHVGEGGRTSVHHDTARSYRDHCFKGERPFACANCICTKRHSNPLFYVAKHHPIVCSGKRLTR